MSTGSEYFTLLNCLDATKFYSLVSFLSRKRFAEKKWSNTCLKIAKTPHLVEVCGSKNILCAKKFRIIIIIIIYCYYFYFGFPLTLLWLLKLACSVNQRFYWINQLFDGKRLTKNNVHWYRPTAVIPNEWFFAHLSLSNCHSIIRSKSQFLGYSIAKRKSV